MLQKRSKYPQKWLGLRATILTKGGKLWGNEQTKIKTFEVLGMVNCGKISIWRKLMVDNGYSVRLVMKTHFTANLHPL